MPLVASDTNASIAKESSAGVADCTYKILIQKATFCMYEFFIGLSLDKHYNV